MLLFTHFRYFEYLAATGPMGGTPVPGRDSFTSALIHALEHLVNHKAEGRFTTVELLNRIKDDSPDFPKDQTPVLSDRKRVGPGGRLMLHPIHPESTKTQIIPSQSPHLESAKMQTVTLHFDFSEKPPLENIEALGLELNKVCEHNSLRVNGVRWGGLKQSMTARAIQSFRQIFLRGRQRRASELREQESILSDCGEESSAHHTPEPPTPSSTSQHSPPIQETLITTDSVIDPTHLSPVLASKRNYDSGNQGQGRAKRRKIASKGRDS